MAKNKDRELLVKTLNELRNLHAAAFKLSQEGAAQGAKDAGNDITNWAPGQMTKLQEQIDLIDNDPDKADAKARTARLFGDARRAPNPPTVKAAAKALLLNACGTTTR